MLNELLQTFGVDKHGATLEVDPITWPTFLSPCFIDVETDEKDGFVGLGMCFDDKTVYYFTQLSTNLSNFLSRTRLVGHNLKFDAKLLVKWGVSLTSENLYGDTILMSYVNNTTKDSHSLKDLGKELGYNWPTYKEIVGKGRSKKTLDKQDVSLVSSYCAMDVFVTYKLYHLLRKSMNINQVSIYNQIELPLMKVLFEMEIKGVRINVTKLKELDEHFRCKLDSFQSNLRLLAGKEINPNSNKQVADILIGRSINLPKTEKGNWKVDKWVLEQYKDDEFVKVLLEYNKIEKLWSTYTQGLLKRDSLPRVYTTYNQVIKSQQTERGISTGRLSSSEPNLQQIPTRTDEGKLLRELFVPEEGNILIDADYSQIEPRLVAHFSQDPFLLNVYKNDLDIYAQLVEGTGRERNDGKTFMLALLYGAGAKKLARNFKCSEEEAQSILDSINKKILGVTAWINRVKYEARQKKGVYTIMKRWIPIPGITTSDLYERYHWERTAVNYMIQGSAAEVIKLAMIQLRKKDYLPLLTVHDELLFEVPIMKNDGTEYPFKLDIKSTMESIVPLSVPLIAEVGIGINWREAKGE